MIIGNIYDNIKGGLKSKVLYHKYNFTYFPWKILTLNTQSQELYSLNPLNLRKGFTPVLFDKAFMCQVIIYIINVL